jgi:hypothetical protein
MNPTVTSSAKAHEETIIATAATLPLVRINWDIRKLLQRRYCHQKIIFARVEFREEY